MLTVLDLFSGIGGMSYGLEATGGFHTVAFCEIEPFPRLVLAHHWPGVPIFEDVRILTAESLGELRPDLICGGFPCQDISVAGKGAGLHGARSGLWSEFARLVGELRPRWVLAENVGALRTRGVDRVCSDLEGEGYAVWPLLVGAWAAGAPHRRERVWIVAQSKAKRLERRLDRPKWGKAEAVRLLPSRSDQPLRWPARPGEPQHEWEEPRLAHAHAEPRGSEHIEPEGGQGGADSERRSTQPEGASWGTGRSELPLGGAAHGLPARLARRANREALKALGNSVVPQIVYAIGQAILKADKEANP